MTMTSVEKSQLYSREVWRATQKRVSEYATQACDASLAKRNSRRLATALSPRPAGEQLGSETTLHPRRRQSADVAVGVTDLSTKVQWLGNRRWRHRSAGCSICQASLVSSRAHTTRAAL